MTRGQLVKSLVAEYQAHGKQAAIALFEQSIKRFEMSQYGIKATILDFRKAIGEPINQSVKGDAR